MKRKADHPVVQCHGHPLLPSAVRKWEAAIRISDGVADGVSGGRPLPARFLVNRMVAMRPI